MKKLLADFLNIKEGDIEIYTFNTENNDFSIETEHDYGRSYPIIKGSIFQPQYQITTKLQQKYYWVNLEELLVFIYNKK